jgi:uncharacterized protein involved in response to NO
MFPLGLVLAWGGVLHWLLHATGLLPDYRPVFHSIAQIQGFMTCFAVGFLFTAIPRRTGTPEPAVWEMIAGIALPAGTTLAAWHERLALTQVLWVGLVGVLMAFALRRFTSASATRRPPSGFVWIPLAFAMGIAGSLMLSAMGLFGDEYYWLHNLGRLFLLQGTFIGLIAGVGSMVLPLITRGDAPPDAGTAGAGRSSRYGHLAAALVLMASFWIENSGSPRGGLALRAAVVLVLLAGVARIWRLPRKPGWHRRLVWISAWMLPVGYALAALFPMQKKAGLHVVFIGGFALMALSVAVHVTLAHGGHTRLIGGRPWQVPLYGGLLLVAMVLRALVDFAPERFFTWIGASAALFLLGTIFWAWLVLPAMARAGDAPSAGTGNG